MALRHSGCCASQRSSTTRTVRPDKCPQLFSFSRLRTSARFVHSESLAPCSAYHATAHGRAVALTRPGLSRSSSPLRRRAGERGDGAPLAPAAAGVRHRPAALAHGVASGAEPPRAWRAGNSCTNSCTDNAQVEGRGGQAAGGPPGGQRRLPVPRDPWKLHECGCRFVVAVCCCAVFYVIRRHV